MNLLCDLFLPDGSYRSSSTSVLFLVDFGQGIGFLLSDDSELFLKCDWILIPNPERGAVSANGTKIGMRGNGPRFE